MERPRAVTIGLGLAAVMGTIMLLMGLGMFFLFTQVYVGMTTFIPLPASDHSRIQGVIVVLVSLFLLTSVIRALKPVRIPRFIIVAICGLLGILWFYQQLPTLMSGQPIDLLKMIVITSLMSAPAVLLMSPPANEYYGE